MATNKPMNKAKVPMAPGGELGTLPAPNMMPMNKVTPRPAGKPAPKKVKK